MATNKTQELSYSERIGSGGSDSILASFYREILLNLGIDISRFQGLLDRYINRQNPNVNTVELSTARTALRRELLSSTMTWKVFIKGLMFLNIKSLTLTIKLYRENKIKVTTHEYSFYLTDQSESEDTEERGILSKLFGQILNDLDVGPEEFEYYLDTYVKKSKPGSSPGVQHTAKSSISREILKSNISWKVFIKGLLFLEATKINLEFQMFHSNKLVSRHSKNLLFK